MKIKPCPFCGEANIGVYEGSTYRWAVARCEECGAQAGEVLCADAAILDGPIKDADRASAIAAWNTRPAATQPAASEGQG